MDKIKEPAGLTGSFLILEGWRPIFTFCLLLSKIFYFPFRKISMDIFKQGFLHFRFFFFRINIFTNSIFSPFIGPLFLIQLKFGHGIIFLNNSFGRLGKTMLD